MKRIITILVMVICGNAFSQMYVSPGSFMYVKDQVVFVTQDIDLQNNGNIYLRNEGQLLQGSAGLSLNKGLGKLSVYQEGTSDNFDYNYWCSPVGDATVLAGNSNFGITMLNRPVDLVNSTPATMLAMTALNGNASPLEIAQRWVFKYINSNLYSQWVSVAAATNLAAGEGFTMKGTAGTDATNVDGVVANNPISAQRYDFRGKPNDGNIFVNVGANNQTLTGNPYPSALHVNAFLLDPSNTAGDGIAYYWEQNKSVNSHFLQQYQGGYGTYAPISPISNGLYVAATFDTYDGSGNLNTTGTSSGLVIARKYAPIGQGFMVEGITPGVLTIKNSHRAYYKESLALSQFERSDSTPENNTPEADQVSHFRINTILNNQYTRQIALAFVPEATDGIDRGIDAGSPADVELPNDVYFLLENERYVIQGINFDVNKRLPLGVKATGNATLRFYVPEVINFDESQPIYIYDAADNSYHNIKTGFYDVTLPTGIYHDRFEVTFTDASLSVPSLTDETFGIVQDNASQQLLISNPNGIELKSCSLYDMSGKLVLRKLNLGSDPNFTVSTSGFSDGVYIVKILTGNNQDVGKKVSVYNKAN